ncbi:MAG: SOSS complex subunit B family protein [Archaeoglobales archaeon]|nr:SOSS complex subunit B family protein [Archaeoglobales archaeon]MDI9643434.1 SOSS complex subunit B family protein [Archaeoglobales archaeon]
MDRLKEIKERFGELLDDKTTEELSKYSPNAQEFTKVAEITPGRVNIKGRVSGIGDPELANELYVSDDSGRVRVMVWDKEIYYKAEIGMEVEIYNGYAKEGKKGIEVHVNKFSIVKFLE